MPDKVRSSRFGRDTTMNHAIEWAFSLAIVLLFAAACQVGLGGPTPTPVTTQVSPTGTPIPTPTLFATSSTLAPTPTPAASPTPTSTPIPTSTPVPPPVASFSVDVSGGRAPFTVVFTDTSQGPVDSWQWDFGDGNSSTEQNATHEYTVAGSYAVQPTVSGPGGEDILEIEDSVTVTPGRLAAVTLAPESASGSTFLY